MSGQFFPYDRDERWRLLLLPLGVKASDGVTVTDDVVRATFGWYSMETPRSNVAGVSISGPHRWYTAVGLRLSLADDGITFGTNHRHGVCLEFVEKIDRVFGFRGHSSLWVSVADPDGLVAALS